MVEFLKHTGEPIHSLRMCEMNVGLGAIESIAENVLKHYMARPDTICFAKIYSADLVKNLKHGSFVRYHFPTATVLEMHE